MRTTKAQISLRSAVCSAPLLFAAKRVNRKVQGVPQSQTAANPRHQQEEKNDKKQTNAREVHRPAPKTV